MSDDARAVAAAAERLERWAGLAFDASGRVSLARAMGQRAAQLELPSLSAYLGQLAAPNAPEVERLLDAVTIRYTWFFRDPEQLEIVEQLIAEAPDRGRPLNVWVPACATGEDAWSVALLARRAGRAATIVGSDLSASAIAAARDGVYGAWSVRAIPEALRGCLAPAGKGLRVPASLRAGVSLVRHNLCDEPLAAPDQAGWDLIVCRNVLFYFSPARSRATVERLARALRPGGWLILGAHEMLHGSAPELRLVSRGGRYALRRLDTDEAPPAARPAAAPASGTGSLLGSLDAAAAHLAARRFAEAIATCDAIVSRTPACAPAHLCLGIAHHLKGDPRAALSPLRMALSLDGRSWPAAYYLARAYDGLGDADESRRCYRRVLDVIDARSAGDSRLDRDLEPCRAQARAAAQRRLAP